MSKLILNKPVSAEEILNHFKDWKLDEESKEYVKFHYKRYEFLLKESLKFIRKIQDESPGLNLTILDIGKAYQTAVLRGLLPEIAVNSMGFGDSRFAEREQDKHFNFDLNDAQYPEKWPEFEEHDLIIMAEVIEHLYTSPVHVLKCIANILKKGGYLIIQTPNACSFSKRVEMLMGRNPFEQIRLSNTNPGHFREYTIEELIDIGMQSGFMPVEYSILNYFNHPGKKKFISTLANMLSSRFREGITVCFQKVETFKSLHDNTIFSSGWHGIEKDKNGFFRWGTGHCLIQFQGLKRDLQLRLFSHFPEIKKKHVNITFTNDDTKEILQKVKLADNQEETVILRTSNLDHITLGLFVEPTWKPALYIPKSDDQRDLGIGIREPEFL